MSSNDNTRRRDRVRELGRRALDEIAERSRQASRRGGTQAMSSEEAAERGRRRRTQDVAPIMPTGGNEQEERREARARQQRAEAEREAASDDDGGGGGEQEGDEAEERREARARQRRADAERRDRDRDDDESDRDRDFEREMEQRDDEVSQPVEGRGPRSGPNVDVSGDATPDVDDSASRVRDGPNVIRNVEEGADNVLGNTEEAARRFEQQILENNPQLSAGDVNITLDAGGRSGQGDRRFVAELSPEAKQERILDVEASISESEARAFAASQDPGPPADLEERRENIRSVRGVGSTTPGGEEQIEGLRQGRRVETEQAVVDATEQFESSAGEEIREEREQKRQEAAERAVLRETANAAAAERIQGANRAAQALVEDETALERLERAIEGQFEGDFEPFRDFTPTQEGDVLRAEFTSVGEARALAESDLGRRFDVFRARNRQQFQQQVDETAADIVGVDVRQVRERDRAARAERRGEFFERLPDAPNEADLLASLGVALPDRDIEVAGLDAETFFFGPDTVGGDTRLLAQPSPAVSAAAGGRGGVARDALIGGGIVAGAAGAAAAVRSEEDLLDDFFPAELPVSEDTGLPTELDVPEEGPLAPFGSELPIQPNVRDLPELLPPTELGEGPRGLPSTDIPVSSGGGGLPTEIPLETTPVAITRGEQVERGRSERETLRDFGVPDRFIPDDPVTIGGEGATEGAETPGELGGDFDVRIVPRERSLPLEEIVTGRGVRVQLDPELTRTLRAEARRDAAEEPIDAETEPEIGTDPPRTPEDIAGAIADDLANAGAVARREAAGRVEASQRADPLSRTDVTPDVAERSEEDVLQDVFGDTDVDVRQDVDAIEEQVLREVTDTRPVTEPLPLDEPTADVPGFGEPTEPQEPTEPGFPTTPGAPADQFRLPFPEGDTDDPLDPEFDVGSELFETGVATAEEAERGIADLFEDGAGGGRSEEDLLAGFEDADAEGSALSDFEQAEKDLLEDFDL